MTVRRCTPRRPEETAVRVGVNSSALVSIVFRFVYSKEWKTGAKPQAVGGWASQFPSAGFE